MLSFICRVFIVRLYNKILWKSIFTLLSIITLFHKTLHIEDMQVILLCFYLEILSWLQRLLAAFWNISFYLKMCLVEIELLYFLFPFPPPVTSSYLPLAPSTATFKLMNHKFIIITHTYNMCACICVCTNIHKHNEQSLLFSLCVWFQGWWLCFE